MTYFYPVVLLILAILLQIHWYTIPFTSKFHSAWRWVADITFFLAIIVGVISAF